MRYTWNIQDQDIRFYNPKEKTIITIKHRGMSDRVHDEWWWLVPDAWSEERIHDYFNSKYVSI